jgi:formylglycine-generating enzyme required for sulfatase activity
MKHIVCDIKPENIVLSKTATGWQVKVLDFGIAKVQGEINSNLTLPGNALGTPQYMSPEQCLGEQLDSRSDIYSFGIVLYEMLCGVVPFSAAVASAIVVQHVNQKPPPLSNHQADISTNINKVVLRALEKKREKRPKTAGTLAKEFLQAVTHEIKEEKPQTEKNIAVSILKPVNLEPEVVEVEIIKEVEEPKIKITELVNLPPIVEITETIENIAEVGSPRELRSPNVQESEILLAELEETVSNVVQSLPPNAEKVCENIEDVKTAELYQLAEILLPNNEEIDVNSENVSEKSVLSISDEIEVNISERDIKAFSAKPDNAQTDLATSETNVETEIVSAINTPTEIVVSDENKVEKETQIFLASTDLDHSTFQRNRLSLAVFTGVFILSLIGFSVWYFSVNKPLEVNSVATNENQKLVEGMVYVPGGDFMMGNERGDEYEKPVHKMTVKPFYVDIYEVTCADYKKFIDATNYKQPRNWKTRDIPQGWEKKPVTAVSWDDANAYAKWAEKRLPTEAEWEFAARGTDGRIYPWGNDWKENMANANGESKEMKDVGAFQGQSPFGAFDMVGNAWEWTSDDAKSYKDGKSILTTTPSQKVIRGGFYGSKKVIPTTTIRGFWGARDERDYGDSGFRCVKD